jgi:hypothetical protein
MCFLEIEPASVTESHEGMKMKTWRSVNERFVGHDLGSGVWRLSTDTPGGPEVYLAGVEADGAETLSRAGLGAVEIDWRQDGVLLSLASAGTERIVRARHAVIHEPLTRLYERLPLERFDEAARRFWTRIFRLVRIPGGRQLLRLIARRARGAR